MTESMDDLLSDGEIFADVPVVEKTRPLRKFSPIPEHVVLYTPKNPRRREVDGSREWVQSEWMDRKTERG